MAEARLQVKVSADAREAVTAFQEVAQSLKGLGSGAEAAAVEADALAKSIEKMDQAKESPKRLATAVGLARFHLDEFKEAAKGAGLSSDQYAAKVAKAEEAINRATARAGKMADALGDNRTRANLAAQGYESLAASAGSLEGMLAKLKDTGTEGQQALADLGFKAIALAAAFKVGTESGTWLDKKLKEIGVDLSEGIGPAAAQAEAALAKLFKMKAPQDLKAQAEGLDAAWTKFRQTIAGTPTPMGLAEKAFEALGLEAKHYGDLLAPLPIQVNAHLAAERAHASALDASRAALEKLIPGWKSLSEQQVDAVAKTRAIADEMDKAAKAGKDWNQAVDPEKVRALAQQLETLGVPLAHLPEKFIAAARAAREFKEQQEEIAKFRADVAKRIEAEAEAKKKEIADYEKSAEAIKKQRAETLALHNAVADMVNALDQSDAALKQQKDSIEANVKAQQDLNQAWKDGLVQLQAVNWEIRHATAKTVELSEVQKDLVENLAQISDKFGVASTWVGHFIFELEEGMKKGTVSTEEFRKKVEDIIRGLTQINAAGHNWMGNLQDELLQITRLLNEFDTATKKAGGK